MQKERDEVIKKIEGRDERRRYRGGRED